MCSRSARFADSSPALGWACDESPPSSSEFHRRRAENEMEKALCAGRLSVALRHLELARLHRERRAAVHLATLPAEIPSTHSIDRTDKEG
jgi:hypothetical protein